jgi:hypothetical protein
MKKKQGRNREEEMYRSGPEGMVTRPLLLDCEMLSTMMQASSLPSS